MLLQISPGFIFSILISVLYFIIKVITILAIMGLGRYCSRIGPNWFSLNYVVIHVIKKIITSHLTVSTTSLLFPQQH